MHGFKILHFLDPRQYIPGVGKMRNCGMRKVKCGMNSAENYRGVVCNLRNAESHYHVYAQWKPRRLLPLSCSIKTFQNVSYVIKRFRHVLKRFLFLPCVALLVEEDFIGFAEPTCRQR